MTPERCQEHLEQQRLLQEDRMMNQAFAHEMRREEEEWNASQVRRLAVQHEADLFKPHRRPEQGYSSRAPPPGVGSSSRAVLPAPTLSEEEVEVYRRHNIPVPDGFELPPG